MQKIVICSVVKWVLSKHALNITTATGNGPANSNVYTCRTCSQFVQGIEGRKSLTGLGFTRLYEMVLKRTSSPRGYSAVHGF